MATKLRSFHRSHLLLRRWSATFLSFVSLPVNVCTWARAQSRSRTFCKLKKTHQSAWNLFLRTIFQLLRVKFLLPCMCRNYKLSAPEKQTISASQGKVHFQSLFLWERSTEPAECLLRLPLFQEDYYCWLTLYRIHFCAQKKTSIFPNVEFS